MSEKSNHQPIVSVITPFLNREYFLRDAIESVLLQTFVDWELILVDDGSTDKSSAIAQEFVQKYPDKIFLIEHENHQNRGASASRNLGIRRAQGEFITFLDSDDVYFPETLARELTCFENCPEADAVCGTVQFWYSWLPENQNKKPEFKVNLGLETEKLYSPPSLLIHNLKALGRKPSINSIMIKKDFLKASSAFEDHFLFASEDQIFWSKISLNGKIYVMKDCLAKYRQHENSSCHISIKNNQDVTDWKIFLDWLETYLIENNIDNVEIRDALKVSRQENHYQMKFKKLKRIYRSVFPLHIRYWMRDKIVSWRTRNDNNQSE